MHLSAGILDEVKTFAFLVDLSYTNKIYLDEVYFYNTRYFRCVTFFSKYVLFKFKQSRLCISWILVVGTRGLAV